MSKQFGWTRQQAQAMAKSFKIETYLTAKAVSDGAEWGVLIVKAKPPNDRENARRRRHMERKAI